MSSAEQIAQWREDLEQLSSLRMRDSGDEYHDDDLAFIERAYSSFFAALKAAEHWKANHDEMKARNDFLRSRPDMHYEDVHEFNHRLEVLDRLDAALKEVERLQGVNELLTVPDPKPDEPLGEYLQRCAVTRNEPS